MATELNVYSYNVNGIRAAIRKGLVEWMMDAQPDVLCLQEVKAMEEQVELDAIRDLGYHIYWHAAEKKGYSGVAVFSKIEASHVIEGAGLEQYDLEGRVLRMNIGPLHLINTYFPSGSSGDHRQAVKMQFLDAYYELLMRWKKENPYVLLCGDFNIAHKEIDIHDPVRNKKYSGFLPEERAWLDKLFAHGYVDAFRVHNAEPDQYSWWNMRSFARETNKGWRIDYHAISEELVPHLKDAAIHQDVVHSDHCPISVDLVIPE